MRWVWPALVITLLGACTPKTDDAIKADVAPPVVVQAQSQSGATSGAPAPPAAPAAPGAKLTVVPAQSDSDALSTIRTARLQAKADGRVLVVFVTATWCPPCKKLKAEIEAGRLDARLGKTTLLAFDADKDNDRLKAAGYTFKFIPFVALPGADGSPADTQEATGEGSDAWKQLLGKLDAWQASGPK